jgi:MFS transporter, FHS family, L-fucose permease
MRLVQSVRSSAVRTALLMCAIFFAAGLTIAAIGPSLPVLATRIGVDIAALGGLFTAFSAGVIVAQLVIVRASQRFGERAALGGSMLLMSVGSLMIAQSSILVLLFGSALLAGAGFGGVLSTGNTLVAGLFPGQSAVALNGINLFFGVGSIVGPALAAAANARFGAPHQAIWVSASMMIVLFLTVALVSAQRSAPAASGHDAPQRSAPVRSWLFGFLLLVYVGTEIGFGAWLTLYMATSAGLDIAQGALVVSGFWLALTGGRALAAASGSRLRAPDLLMICLFGLLLGAAVLSLSIGHLALTVAGVLLFGLSCGPVFPTVLAILTGSAQGAKATSRALALGNTGGMLLPALIGLLLARVGPLAVTMVLVVAALSMIGLAIATRRQPAQALLPGSAECVPAE